jgi:nucleotide-binding universal stress UspA family protein
VFRTVLCGVDGTPAGLEAVRQAALLARAGGRLQLLAVRWDGIAVSARDDVARALVRAADVARALQVDPHVASEPGADPADLLLLEAAGSDLVVVGDHSQPHWSGIAVGATALALVHRSAAPVLVARRPPRGASFPGRILIAADAEADAATAAHLGARLGAVHGVPVASVHAAAPDDLPDAIAAAATRGHGAGLVITSERALPPSAVRRTTAERIAGAVPCSVLVARTAPPGCG